MLRSVREVHCHSRRLDRRGRVFLEDDLRPQRANGRIGNTTVLVLRKPGGAKEERCGDAMLQTDFGVAPVRDIRSVRSRISGWPRTTTRSIASITGA
jgi:hypothetical protein